MSSLGSAKDYVRCAGNRINCNPPYSIHDMSCPFCNCIILFLSLFFLTISKIYLVCKYVSMFVYMYKNAWKVLLHEMFDWFFFIFELLLYIYAMYIDIV